MLAKAKPQELTQAGDYDLLERLGEGAMGTVYRGRHRPTGLIVAVKVVNDNVAKDTLLLKRFERRLVEKDEADEMHLLGHLKKTDRLGNHDLCAMKNGEPTHARSERGEGQ